MIKYHHFVQDYEIGSLLLPEDLASHKYLRVHILAVIVV